LADSTTPEIIVYTHPDCGFSAAVKFDYDNRGIRYREIDISIHPETIPELERLAGGVLAGVPVSVPAAGVRGRVLSTARAVDPASQTVLLRAEIREGASRLFAGSLVEAVIELPGAAGKWTVPAAAIVRNAGKAMLFVRTSAGFAPREVVVVSEGATDSVVSGRLTGEEQIAVRGVAAIKAALAGIGGE